MPIIIKVNEISIWEIKEITMLPKRERKTLDAVIRKGIPLNKRMRKLWKDIQFQANGAEMSNWLAEYDDWVLE